MERLKENRIVGFCEKVLFPVILALYPLLRICYGVEWTDTGYNYANFAYMEQMDPMWKFSTYLANAVGNFFTRLPVGDRMMGLNFYTTLPIVVLALGGYFFFVKKIKMPSVPVFAGEMIAISLCWCPTSLLYNYLTYLLMFVAVVCLYMAMSKEKNIWFVAAGIALGLNVFVRFSNLAQIAFILGVWVYGIIQKKGLKKIMAWTGWCVLGYLIGFGGFFLVICIRYGAEEYISSIMRLFDMTGEATDYSMFSMVESQIRNYVQNLKWLALMVPFMAIGFLGFGVLPKKLLWLKKVGYVGCMALVFYWLRNQNMYNFDYRTLESTYQWAVCILTFNILIGIYVIFSKKASGEDKLLCGLSILLAVLTPLGSNNHLFASMNNLFFAGPVILWMLWKLLKKIPEKKVCTVKGIEVHLFGFPLKALVAMIVVMLLGQSLLLGGTYVFREEDGKKNLHTKVENSDILKGMYTGENRAALLDEIFDYARENELKGKEVLLYGNVPALSYYLEMPFALSPWPDLPSYNYNVMCGDMEKIRERIAEGVKAPVLILEAGYGQRFLDGESVTDDRKFALLAQFATEYEYKLKFANDKIMLFEAD